jgi:UDP-N-acetyl-2-amino-2-deoxyglucuronate dehydrogenase
MAFRFAIVGCGRIAPRHADSLKTIPGVALVACADTDFEKAKKFGEKYGLRAFGSIDDLLNWGNFDVANVCTPSGDHADHSIQIMEAQKHVIVEKPMALRIEDADRMIETSYRTGRKLFVVKQNRFNLPVQAVRNAFDRGRFGRILMGTVRVRWSRDQAYYDQAPWRGTWAMDGGVFSNQASHHVDLLEWFLGDVESVFAKTERQLAKIECEDTGVAILKFKSGALGIIEATTATRPRDLEGSLSIMGEKGSAEISGFAVNKMRHYEFVESLPEDKEVFEKFSENPPNVYGFGHTAYLQNVVSHLNGIEASIVDGLEGRKSLELINALYVSAETKAEISLKYRVQSRLGQVSKMI